MVLENKLREANRQLVQAFNQNEKLVNALYEAREQITSLRRRSTSSARRPRPTASTSPSTRTAP